MNSNQQKTKQNICFRKFFAQNVLYWKLFPPFHRCRIVWKSFSSYQEDIEGFQLFWLGPTSEELAEGRGHCRVTQTECKGLNHKTCCWFTFLSGLRLENWSYWRFVSEEVQMIRTADHTCLLNTNLQEQQSEWSLEVIHFLKFKQEPDRCIRSQTVSTDIADKSYRPICSPTSADIKTVRQGWKHHACTCDLKLCNHVVCPAEGGALCEVFTVQCTDVLNEVC